MPTRRRVTTISSTTIRSRRRSRRPWPTSGRVATGTGGNCWLWSRFAALSSCTSCDSSSFCFVTWSRRCSMLWRRSSSSRWESEGETAVGGRASTGGMGGGPPWPMVAAHHPARVPNQGHHRNPARPAGIGDPSHWDSHLSDLSRRSAPIGPGSGWPEDDNRNYTPDGRRVRMCDRVLLRGCHRSLRDERFGERPQPRINTSSVIVNLVHCLQQNAGRDDFSGCDRLKVRL